MTNNYEYYSKKIDTSFLYKLEANKYKNLSYSLIDDKQRLIHLLDDMAYVLDLLVDDSSNNRNWFKVKEVLDKYEEFRREQGTTRLVDSSEQQARKGKQDPA